MTFYRNGVRVLLQFLIRVSRSQIVINQIVFSLFFIIIMVEYLLIMLNW